MKTVQMTLDDDLVRSVDRVSKKLQTCRMAFTRDALCEALARYSTAQEEKHHRLGYERHPIVPDEFAAWESEQNWGDK